MDKSLLVVSGGIEAVPGIITAKNMGLNVVVSDMDPNAPGFKYANDKIISSTYDIEGTVSKAKEYHNNTRSFNGVVSIAADVPLTVASIAHELGLPGITLKTAHLTSDKLQMKMHLQKHDIPLPWFTELLSVKHLEEIIENRGFPLIIKPVDNRGARGVLKIDETIDIKWAYQYCLKHSTISKLIAEEYIHGPQISTETLIVDRKCFTVGFSDRNYEYLEKYAPFIIENGGNQPSCLNENQVKQVSELAERAALALGITSGIAKGDMVLSEEGPKVIEIASRLSGGWFSTDQIPVATGVNLVQQAIKLALNETINPDDLIPKYHKGVAIRYFFPEPGKIIAIHNKEQFNDVDWVHKLKLFYQEGDTISAYSDHTKRAGFVITVGESREEANERAEKVISTIEIKTY